MLAKLRLLIALLIKSGVSYPGNDLGSYKCWEAAVEDLMGGDHPTYKQD